VSCHKVIFRTAKEVRGGGREEAISLRARWVATQTVFYHYRLPPLKHTPTRTTRAGSIHEVCSKITEVRSGNSRFCFVCDSARVSRSERLGIVTGARANDSRTPRHRECRRVLDAARSSDVTSRRPSRILTDADNFPRAPPIFSWPPCSAAATAVAPTPTPTPTVIAQKKAGSSRPRDTTRAASPTLHGRCFNHTTFGSHIAKGRHVECRNPRTTVFVFSGSQQQSPFLVSRACEARSPCRYSTTRSSVPSEWCVSPTNPHRPA